jgi:hypothetical protein
LGTLILIFPAWLLMEIGLFIFSIRSGFWLEKLKVYGYFLQPKTWEKIGRERKEKTRLRQGFGGRKDKDVINFFTGKIEFQEIDNFVINKIANPIFNLYWQVIKHLIVW